MTEFLVTGDKPSGDTTLRSIQDEALNRRVVYGAFGMAGGKQSIAKLSKIIMKRY